MTLVLHRRFACRQIHIEPRPRRCFWRDYIYGYVVASIAAGALKGKAVKGIWNVTGFDETTAESLGEAIDSKIEKVGSPAIKETFQKAKDDIDRYFG